MPGAVIRFASHRVSYVHFSSSAFSADVLPMVSAALTIRTATATSKSELNDALCLVCSRLCFTDTESRRCHALLGPSRSLSKFARVLNASSLISLYTYKAKKTRQRNLNMP